MGSVVGLDSGHLIRLPQTLSFTTASLVSGHGVEQRRPTHRVTSTGHAGVNRKSPNDAPELMRPISANP